MSQNQESKVISGDTNNMRLQIHSADLIIMH
jgi:hypothetical protein